MGYYIVDTNIDKPQLTNFINKPENNFFYTNTVKKEIRRSSEALPNKIIPDVFKFVDSKVHSSTIDFILADLQVSIGLSDIRLKKFRNDLSIIIEAGFICYDITPENDYKGALLLTNNLKLYKKFIRNQSNQEKLERAIDLHGLEHLIEIVRPEYVL